MSTKPYPVVEARRQLPRLMDLARSGKGPIYLGRRGRAEVALVSVADSRSPKVRRPLQGLVEFHVSAALKADESAVAREFNESLTRIEAMVLGPTRGVRTVRTKKKKAKSGA